MKPTMRPNNVKIGCGHEHRPKPSRCGLGALKGRVKVLGFQAIAKRTVAEWELIDTGFCRFAQKIPSGSGRRRAGMIAEASFTSASSAVECAIAIQRTLARHTCGFRGS